MSPGYWQRHNWHPSTPHLANTIIPIEALSMARVLNEFHPGTKFIVAKLECFERTGLFDPVLFAVEKTPRGIVLHPMCAWLPDGTIVEPPA